jgi:hypothetical protein
METGMGMGMRTGRGMATGLKIRNAKHRIFLLYLVSC